MAQLIVSEWMTLDGVFDADTMKEWFEPYTSTDRMAYIKDTIHGSDALLIGKTTYKMFESFWPHEKDDNNGPAGKLNSMSKYVVSSTLKTAEWNNSTIIKENIVETISRLKQQAGKDILISGSATLVQTLMKTELIDEYQFLIQPIIMGSGKKFFKEGMEMTKLKLFETKTLSLGVILLRYQAII